MTENKRFTIFQDSYDTIYIRDKEVFRGNGLRIGNEENVKFEHILKVVECLNELHEENQTLKEKLKYMAEQYGYSEKLKKMLNFE